MGSARSRDQQFGHFFRSAPLEALEDGPVLAVDGQDADAAGCGFLHDQFDGSDEGFLVGQGDVHPLLDGVERRFDTGGADEGRQDDLGVAFIDEFQEAVTAGKDSTRRTDVTAQFISRLFVDHAGPFHLMVPDLAGHFLPMGISGDAGQAEGLGMGVDDVDGLGPDRAGTA